MHERDTHLIIVYPEAFPDELLARFEADIAHASLRVSVNRPPRTLETKAALEWLVPTAVVVYLTKPYFEAFLEEAGRDHYGLLKGAITRLWKTFFHPSEKLIVYRVGRLGTSAADPFYSRTFSVVAEWTATCDIKLMVRESASEKEFAAVVDHFIDEVKLLNSGTPEAALRRLLVQTRPIDGQILVTYDASSGAFILVDPMSRVSNRSAAPARAAPGPATPRPK